MKKLILLVLILIAGINCSSQKQTTTINQVLDSKKGREIVLVKIINDSRCPEKTQCIWEGEVNFEVAVYENGKIIEQTQLTLNSKKQEEVTDWFKKQLGKPGENLKNVGVVPYPKVGVSVKYEDYYIDLVY